MTYVLTSKIIFVSSIDSPTMDKYSSDNGFVTSVWGPGLWHFLHTMSFNYPVTPTKEQKAQYKQFVMSLQHVLPCRHCRENFPQNIQAVPFTAYSLKNRNTFSRWMYRFHAHINSMLGKETPYTYEQIRSTYEEFRAGCSDTSPTSSVAKRGKHNKKEKGCVRPAKKKTSQKCVIRIVPTTVSCPSFQVIQ